MGWVGGEVRGGGGGVSGIGGRRVDLQIPLCKLCNKGFSRPRHPQGKGKTGLCGQAWSFPLFDPM